MVVVLPMAAQGIGIDEPIPELPPRMIKPASQSTEFAADPQGARTAKAILLAGFVACSSGTSLCLAHCKAFQEVLE